MFAGTARAEAGELLFGTVDTWLIWKMTSGQHVHVTDPSNASRTLLYNIHTGAWDKELLKLFRIPASLLPEVRTSSEVFGEVSTSLGLQKVPIAGIAGDPLSQNCGRALCADCLDPRPGPGGMTNIGRRHGRTVFLLTGGLRVAAQAA